MLLRKVSKNVSVSPMSSSAAIVLVCETEGEELLEFMHLGSLQQVKFEELVLWLGESSRRSTCFISFSCLFLVPLENNSMKILGYDIFAYACFNVTITEWQVCVPQTAACPSNSVDNPFKAFSLLMLMPWHTY